MKSITNNSKSKRNSVTVDSTVGSTGVRAGMAALLAASTVMPVFPAAQAAADEAEPELGSQSSTVQQGSSPAEQQRIDDKQASEVNLAAAQQSHENALRGKQAAQADLAAAQQRVDSLRSDVSAAQNRADAEKTAALEKTLAEAQAALDAAEQAKQASDKAEQAKAAAADALDVAKADAEAKEKESQQAQAGLAEAQRAYELAGGSNEFEAAQKSQQDAAERLKVAQSALDEANRAQSEAATACDAANSKALADAAALESAQSAATAAADELTKAQAELAAAEDDLARVEAGETSAAVVDAQAKVATCEQAVKAAQSAKAAADADVTSAEIAAQSSQAKYAEASEALAAAQADVDAGQKAVSEASAAATSAQNDYEALLRLKQADEANLAASKAELDKATIAAQEAKKASSEAQEAVASAQAAYDAAAEALKTAQADLSRYQELAKKGSLGFFEEIGAVTAVKYLTDPDKWSDIENCGTDPNHLDYRATSLDNMKLALETMSKVNDLRAENGVPPLKICSALMAAAQINLNWTYKNTRDDKQPFDHAPSHIGGGENIAAGYKDPFRGWYDKEKPYYDQDMTDGVLDGYDADGNEVTGNYGHYLNILNESYTCYGCAQVDYFHCQDFDGFSSGTRWVYDDEYVEGNEIVTGGPDGSPERPDGKPWTQHEESYTADDELMRFYGEKAYTADEYYDMFMSYYNKVKGNIDPKYQAAVDEAKASLEKAQSKAAELNAVALGQEETQRRAQASVDAAQATVDADGTSIAAAADEVAAKKAAAAEASNALSNAQEKLGAAQKAADDASVKAEADMGELNRAQQVQGSAQGKLNAANADLASARSYLESVSSDGLKMAQKRLDAARGAMEAAQRVKDETDVALVAARETASESAAAQASADAKLHSAQVSTVAAADDLHAAELVSSSADQRLNIVKPLAEAEAAAQMRVEGAVAARNAALSAVADAERGVESASKVVESAKASLAAAQERAGHLGRFATAAQALRSASTFDEAWEAGTFGDEWISMNAADLESMLAQKKAAYEKALSDKEAAECQLANAEAGLAEKQAVYQGALRALEDAESELAQAQAWYDRAHPAPKAETVQAEASLDEKIAGAKHVAKAEGDGAVLAQTGDAAGEVFWVAGIAFVAAGVTIGAAAKRRRGNE